MAIGKLIFECVLPGRVGIKKNSTQRKWSFKHRRTLTIASDKYMAWEQRAVLHLKHAWAGRPKYDKQVIAQFTFHFANRHSLPDLSNAYQGPEDALQKAGVLLNDKLIAGHDGSRIKVGGTPHVVVRVFEFLPDEGSDDGK